MKDFKTEDVLITFEYKGFIIKLEARNEKYPYTARANGVWMGNYETLNDAYSNIDFFWRAFGEFNVK